MGFRDYVLMSDKIAEFAYKRKEVRSAYWVSSLS